MRVLLCSLCVVLFSSGTLYADELVLPTPVGLQTGMNLEQVQELLKRSGGDVESHPPGIEKSPFGRTFSVHKLRATFKTGDVGRVKLYLIGAKLSRWKIYAAKSGKKPLDMSALGKPGGESTRAHFWWNEAKIFGVKCALNDDGKTYKKCEARDYSQLIGVVGTEQEIRGLFMKEIAGSKKK